MAFDALGALGALDASGALVAIVASVASVASFGDGNKDSGYTSFVEFHHNNGVIVALDLSSHNYLMGILHAYSEAYAWTLPSAYGGNVGIGALASSAAYTVVAYIVASSGAYMVVTYIAASFVAYMVVAYIAASSGAYMVVASVASSSAARYKSAVAAAVVAE